MKDIQTELEANFWRPRIFRPSKSQMWIANLVHDATIALVTIGAVGVAFLALAYTS